MPNCTVLQSFCRQICNPCLHPLCPGVCVMTKFWVAPALPDTLRTHVLLCSHLQWERWQPWQRVVKQRHLGHSSWIPLHVGMWQSKGGTEGGRELGEETKCVNCFSHLWHWKTRSLHAPGYTERQQVRWALGSRDWLRAGGVLRWVRRAKTISSDPQGGMLEGNQPWTFIAFTIPGCCGSHYMYIRCHSPTPSLSWEKQFLAQSR